MLESSAPWSRRRVTSPDCRTRRAGLPQTAAMVRLLPPALTFALWLFCVIDVICARQDGIRHLGKNTWLLIVLFFPLVGSIAWLVAGRSQSDRPLTREQGAAP